MASRLSRYLQDVEASWDPAVPSVRTGPAAPEARAAYFKFLHHQWGGDPEEIIHWGEWTVKLDSSWGVGHLLLAGEYLSRIGAPGRKHWITKTRTALKEARALGLESDPHFLLTEGSMLWRLEGNLAGAEARFRESILAGVAGYRIEYANLMVASGLAREAQPVIAELTRIAPHHLVFWYHLAIARAVWRNPVPMPSVTTGSHTRCGAHGSCGSAMFGPRRPTSPGRFPPWTEVSSRWC